MPAPSCPLQPVGLRFSPLRMSKRHANLWLAGQRRPACPRSQGIRNWRNGPFTKGQITNVRRLRDSRRTCHALQRHPNNDPSLGNNRIDRAVLMRQTTSLVLPRARWSRYRQRMRRPLCQAAANRSAVHLQLVRTRSSPMSTSRCALRCGALVDDRSGGAADRP
jgi:hypothetical protein